MREKPLTAEELSQFHRLIAQGVTVRSFVGSEGWKNLVKPYLDAKKQEILEQNHFRPGSDIPSIERIALLNAYNAGRKDALDDIYSQLDIWANLAKESASAITADQNRRSK